jgi:hypothetical protein
VPDPGRAAELMSYFPQSELVRVGPTGKAYGLDMTDEMLALAEENKRKSGITDIVCRLRDIRIGCTANDAKTCKDTGNQRSHAKVLDARPGNLLRKPVLAILHRQSQERWSPRLPIHGPGRCARGWIPLEQA